MRVFASRAALLFAAGLTASCLPGAFRPVSPDPVIAVDQDKWDFGTITNQGSVEHIFTLRNKGGKNLNIARVQTSCGCTAAVLGHQQLKPGETTPLKVTFDARGRHGAQSRTIWVHSDDPKTPQQQITVTSSIVDANAGPKPQVSSSLTPGAAPSGTLAAAPAPSATALDAVPAASGTAMQPAPAAPR